MRKENTGVLFIKNKKTDKQPDFDGEISIDGKEYKLAGWKNTSTKGVNYISLKVSEPEKKTDFLDDDIGF